jgi:hypothetical protein
MDRIRSELFSGVAALQLVQACTSQLVMMEVSLRVHDAMDDGRILAVRIEAEFRELRPFVLPFIDNDPEDTAFRLRSRHSGLQLIETCSKANKSHWRRHCQDSIPDASPHTAIR